MRKNYLISVAYVALLTAAPGLVMASGAQPADPAPVQVAQAEQTPPPPVLLPGGAVPPATEAEDAQKAAAQEKLKKQQEAEAAAKAEADKKAAEDAAAAQKAAEDDAARKAAEDEELKRKQEAEAAAQAEATRQAAEKAAAEKSAADAAAAAARKAEEDAAAKAAADEELKRKQEAEAAANAEAAAKAEAERQAAEKAESDRVAAEAAKIDEKRLKAERKAAAERAAKEKAEAEKAAAAQIEQAKAAEAKALADKAAAEKAAAEAKSNADKASLERALKEAQKAAAQAAADRAAAESAAADARKSARDAKRQDLTREDIILLERAKRGREARLADKPRERKRSDAEKIIDGISRLLATEAPQTVNRNGVETRTQRFRTQDGRVVEKSIRTMPNGDKVVITRVIRPDGTITERTRLLDESDDNDAARYTYKPRSGERPRSGGRIVIDAPRGLSIPLDRYVIEGRRASPKQLRETLTAAPVERVRQAYSIDDIKQSQALRAKMRRVDLDTITFEFGQAAVPDYQIRNLAQIAETLRDIIRRNRDEVFLLEGHTDAVGSELYNLQLSELRAQSVKYVLVDAFGLPEDSFVTEGYGEEYLKVLTDGPEELNRRVTIRRITPLVRR